MSNDLIGDLLWTSRAGVMMQALDLAAEGGHPKRRSRSRPDAPAPSKLRLEHAGARLPSPLAAVGLVYIGAMLGAALAAALIA